MLTGPKKKGPISIGAQKYSGVPRVFRPKPVRAELLDGPVKWPAFGLSAAQNRFVFSVHKIAVGELHD